MEYQFEKYQPLLFEIIDEDKKGSYELIGSVETTLGHIMGA